MNDFDKMRDKIGNRFAMILIASERMREIQRERRVQEELLHMDSTQSVSEYISKRKQETVPAKQVFDEIENGKIGAEYLDKIKTRIERSKNKKLR